MSEGDEKVFLQHQAAFLSYWKSKEPAFILYYKQEYFERKGSRVHCTWISLYHSRDSICISSMSIPIFEEKWPYATEILITVTQIQICLWKGKE